ncbi:MAG: hypothetical protein AAF727_13270 [Pseudomonadota bacterium]
MATQSISMPNQPLDVATGAQNVTVSFADGSGEWQITSGGALSRHGHWLGQKSASLALADGETLTITGAGILVATADTFSAAFDALPKLTV